MRNLSFRLWIGGEKSERSEWDRSKCSHSVMECVRGERNSKEKDEGNEDREE